MLGPLTLFDTSRGIVVVQEIAMKMTEMTPEQRRDFLEDIKSQTISFLEEYKNDYRKLQTFLYTYAVDLFRTVNYISVVFDRVYDYLQATAKPIFEWFSKNGLQLHLLVANDFADLSRLLTLFPDFFSAAGLPCISPYIFALRLMEQDGLATVSDFSISIEDNSNAATNSEAVERLTEQNLSYEKFRILYERYKDEAIAMCDEAVKKLSEQHCSYIFVDPNEDTMDHFELSLSYKENDGHLVAVKMTGPEDGKGSLIYSEHPRKAGTTLSILNEKIELLRETAIAMKESGTGSPEELEPFMYDVIRYLYDVYMDDNAYVYVPYMGNMPLIMNEGEDGLGVVVFTLPEEQLPELEHPELEEYKKESFRDKVDFVLADLEHFCLEINPGTFYAFEVYDWNLEYIIARKNGAESFPLKDEDGNIYDVFKW